MTMTKKEEALREISENLIALSKAITEFMEIQPEEEVAESQIKFEDVRKVLAEISKQGKTREMKALLSKYGAKRLSDVNPKDYAEILTAAKEIANA